MKRSAVFLLSLAALAWIATPSWAQSKAAPGFEKLKSLAGVWEGKGPEAESFEVTYQLISGGTSLMEMIMPGTEKSMVTVYHLDGEQLMMTHYCMVNNQPRMRAQVPAGEVKKLSFSFVDATNMAKPTDMHMHSMSFSFQDKDHFTQEWSMTKDGKTTPVVFHLTRKQ